MRATRFKFTMIMTITVILAFFISLGADIYTAIVYNNMINLSQFTIFLGGALVARWIDSWSTYFKSREQEDADNNTLKLVNNLKDNGEQ